jgi:hypothetical protein
MKTKDSLGGVEKTEDGDDTVTAVSREDAKGDGRKTRLAAWSAVLNAPSVAPPSAN